MADRSPVLGGRAMAVPDEGFKVNVGGHLIEDPGSGLTKVFEHVGKELVHGTVSAEMPVWDHEKQVWGSVRDRYSGSKSELKKVIKALIETPYSELDRWDDKNLRQWLHQYTDDQGVIDLFEFITVLECMTDQWWDHSASDNLYVRKMHFSERGTAAYSCWPGRAGTGCGPTCPTWSIRSGSPPTHYRIGCWRGSTCPTQRALNLSVVMPVAGAPEPQ